MNNLKQLPLHAFHLGNGAKITSFAGWEMPLSYGSSVKEHMMVRENLGIFDVSHMGELIVKGPQSVQFLNYALTNNFSDMLDGQAMYTLMCNDNGGVIDDLIVYRFSSEKFFLCVNAANVDKDYSHLNNIRKSFDCEELDVSDQYGLIAIQGPQSTKFLEETLQENFSDIPRMHFVQKSFLNHLSLVARTGYTGEDGFELFLPIEIIYEFANLITSSFSEESNAWVGLAARDSLRLEAGFCLHGNEISENISPIEARLLWAVSFEKLDFIGKSKLNIQKDNSDYGHVLHYEALHRRIPRQGDIIYLEGSVAGKVLSGGYSPLIKKPIGTAYVQKDYISLKQNGLWNADVAGSLVPLQFAAPVLKRRN